MPADPARLLAAVADALNQCERAGITVDPDHGAVSTRWGYVLAVGDGRLGGRWAVRQKLPADDRKGNDGGSALRVEDLGLRAGPGAH